MRTATDIEMELTHLNYTRALIDSHLAAAKQELDVLRQDAFAKSTSTKRLSAFFKTHGHFLVDVCTGDRTKDHYEIAKHIWRSRDALVPFARSFVMRKNTAFRYDTTATSAEAINSIANLCGVLAAHKWIAFTKYADRFDIVPSLTGVQKSFMHYGWSEEITLYLVDKTLKAFTTSRPLNHKLFWDVKLKRIDPPTTNPVDMQLDLVGEIGDRFYVFETKSGPVLSIDRWVDRTRLFEGDQNRFITCTANESLDPRIFHPFRLFTLPSLERQFTGLLEADFPANARTSGSALKGLRGQP